LALCGRGVVGLIHLGLLDVTAYADMTKAASAAFVFFAGGLDEGLLACCDTRGLDVA